MGFDPAPTPRAQFRGGAESSPVAAGVAASYGRAIRSHPWLLTCVFVVVLAAGVAWAFVRSPSYQATARVLVNPLPQSDTTFLGLPLLRDSGDPTTNLETAATLIDSTQAATLTARRIGHGWTDQRVEGAVNVQPEGASQIVDVVATAASPSLAAQLANTFTTAALEVRAAQLQAAVAQDINAIQGQLASIHAPASAAAANLESELSALRPLAAGQDPTLSISQNASAPHTSTGLSKAVIGGIALVAAIVLASGIALLIELLRSPRILSEEQLISILPEPVIARVPVVPRRLRRRERALRRPLPPGVSEAMRSMRIQLDLLRRDQRTILVTSPFHGDGKTTTVVNLAREMAASGARVIIVDVDLRKPDIGVSLGIGRTVDLPSALESADPLAALVESPVTPGVLVLPARADEDFVALDRVAHALPAFLEMACRSADYVLLDAPPLGEVTDVLRFIDEVEDILLVSRLGNTTVGTLEVTRELLNRGGRHATGHVIIGASPRIVQGYGYQYRGPKGRRGDRSRPDPGEPISADPAEMRQGLP